MSMEMPNIETKKNSEELMSLENELAELKEKLEKIGFEKKKGSRSKDQKIEDNQKRREARARIKEIEGIIKKQSPEEAVKGDGAKEQIIEPEDKQMEKPEEITKEPEVTDEEVDQLIEALEGVDKKILEFQKNRSEKSEEITKEPITGESSSEEVFDVKIKSEEELKGMEIDELETEEKKIAETIKTEEQENKLLEEENKKAGRTTSFVADAILFGHKKYLALIEKVIKEKKKTGIVNEPAPDLGAQGQEAQEPKPEDQKEKIIIITQELKDLFAGELKDEDKENILNKALEIIKGKNGYDLRLKLDDKSEYLTDAVDSYLIDKDSFSVNIKTKKGKEFAVEFDFGKDDVSVMKSERTDDHFVVNLYKELASKYGERGDLIDQKKSTNNKEEIDRLNQKLQGVNSKINYLYEKIVELGMSGLIDEEKKKVEKIGKFIEKEKSKRIDRSAEFMSGIEGADLVDDKIEKQGGFRFEVKEPVPEPVNPDQLSKPTPKSNVITPEIMRERSERVAPRGITEAIRTLEETEEKLFKVIAGIPNEDRALAIKHNRGERLSPEEVEIAKGVNTLQELKTVISIDTLSAMIAKSRYMSFEEGRKTRRIVLEEMAFLKDAEERALFHAEKNLNEMIARKEIEPIKAGAVNRFAKAVVRTREIETPIIQTALPVSPEAESQATGEGTKKKSIWNRVFGGEKSTPEQKEAEKINKKIDVEERRIEWFEKENGKIAEELEKKEKELEKAKQSNNKKKADKINAEIEKFRAKKAATVAKNNEEIEKSKKELTRLKLNENLARAEQGEFDSGEEGAESLNKKIESAQNAADLQGVFDSLQKIEFIINNEENKKQFQEEVLDKINNGSDNALSDAIAYSKKEIADINASKLNQDSKNALVKFYGKVIEVAEGKKGGGGEEMEGVVDMEKLKKFDSQFSKEEFDKLDRIKTPNDLKSAIRLLESIIDISTEGVPERKIDAEGREIGRLHGKDLALNFYFGIAFKHENKTKTELNEMMIISLEHDRKIFTNLSNANGLKNAEKYASKVFDVIDRLRKEILEEKKEKGARTRVDFFGSGSGKEGKEQKVDENETEPIEIDERTKEGIKKGLEKIKKDNEDFFGKIGGLTNSFSKDERLFGEIFTKEWFDNYMKDMGIEYGNIKDIKTKDFMAAIKTAYEEVKGDGKDNNKKPPKPEDGEDGKEKRERSEPKVERKFKAGDKVWVNIGNNFVQREVVAMSDTHGDVVIESGEKGKKDQLVDKKELAKWQEEHENLKKIFEIKNELTESLHKMKKEEIKVFHDNILNKMEEGNTIEVEAEKLSKAFNKNIKKIITDEIIDFEKIKNLKAGDIKSIVYTIYYIKKEKEEKAKKKEEQSASRPEVKL